MRGSVPNRPSGMGRKRAWCQWVHDSIFSFSPRRASARGESVEHDGRGVSSSRWTRAAEVARASNSILLTDASNGDYFICRTLSVSIDATTDRRIRSRSKRLAQPTC